MIDARELVFAVDADNQPIEPVERKLAHSTGVWHRVAHIIVYRRDGRVLCAKRSLKKDLSPGKWEAVHGGHLMPGQDERAGAAAELFEETGIAVNPGQIRLALLNRQDQGGRVREFQYVFVLRYDGPDHVLKPEPDEVDEMNWLPIAEVKLNISNNGNWVRLGYELRVLKEIDKALNE